MDENTATTTALSPLAVPPATGAKLAGVGRTKFYEAIRFGEFPSFKFGARRLVRVAAIEAWLAYREKAAMGDAVRASPNYLSE